MIRYLGRDVPAGAAEIHERSRSDGRFRLEIRHPQDSSASRSSVRNNLDDAAGAAETFRWETRAHAGLIRYVVGTVEDQLAAHRVPPQLMGIIPSNAGGFGDVHKAAEVFNALEIELLKARLRELNDWLGIDVVRFKDFETPKG